MLGEVEIGKNCPYIKFNNIFQNKCQKINKLVDLADRKWYEVEVHHGNHSWKYKMILRILRFAVLRSWIYSTRVQFE
jgi:hypothetical protein